MKTLFTNLRLVVFILFEVLEFGFTILIIVVNAIVN